MNYLLITQARLTPIVPRTYDDDYIERWGDEYVAHPYLRAIGISFEQFLQFPRELLESASVTTLIPLPEAHKFYPLLPKQRAVQERVDAEAAGQMRLPLDRAEEHAR
jgi:hypothetical protein